MQAHSPALIHTLQPVTGDECEQIAGGLDYAALISVGVEVLEMVLTCVVASALGGVPCFH